MPTLLKSAKFIVTLVWYAGIVLEPFSSSTRCEIVGLLVGVSAPHSVHIATDSANAAAIASSLIDCSKLRRPLQLLSDGDLWEAFRQACEDKGPGTVKVSWTKGHASLASMLDGTCSLAAAVHNSIADKAAEQGAHTATDRAKADLARYYDYKQKAKDRLFAAIHRRIARVCAKAAELRHEREAAARDAKSTNSTIPTPIPPSYPSLHVCRITLLSPPHSR